MTNSEIYISNLQSKIFKLLPMRESNDAGFENHIDEYIDNLCTQVKGAFSCYPDIAQIPEVIEVECNLHAMKDNLDMEYPKWRSTILRSTRLLQTVLTRDFGEV